MSRTLTKLCAHCGSAFAKDPRNTHAYWAKAKYCGHACAGKANSERFAAIRPTKRDKFEQQIAKSDGCWIWTGLTDKDGYGLLNYDGVQYRANRVALELDGRPVSEGLYACHHCDTPACVRPDHLYAGTPLENSRDAVARGQSPRGERQHMAKLTEDAVRHIRSSSESEKALALKFGVSDAAIYMVRAGKTWRHVA